ncbi:MAG: hypothetical protein ACI9OJ_004350 [Myxococcota bacterium]
MEALRRFHHYYGDGVQVECPAGKGLGAPYQTGWTGLVAKRLRQNRISCGFPGVVVEGVVQSAGNLDEACRSYDLAAVLIERFGKPARVANGADVQG